MAGARAERGDLRRRHPARRPGVGPQERERRAHEPGDAAPGDPAVPPALGDVPHAAAADRRRRAALAARHLRQQRRARPAPAAARLRALRLDARRSASRARRSATRRSSPRRCAGIRSRAIDDDGSPQSERCFGLWQRPLLDEETGRRLGANAETAELLAAVRARRPPDARVHPQPARRRARRGAGQAAAAGTTTPDAASRVAAYRAGYLPEERRELEKRLGDGSLLGVAATNALELGIDVGGLDAVVLNGFPGTLASMRQQAGRAGRTGRRAAAVLVAGDDQLDQWYAAHPTELFGRDARGRGRQPVEPVRAARRRSRARRTSCRSSRATRRGSGPGSTTRCASSCSTSSSSRGPGRCTGPDASRRRRGSGCAPDRRSSTASSAGTTTATTGSSAPSTRAAAFHVAHPGALYLHQGRQWRVERLDLDDHVAWLEPGRRRGRVHADPRGHRHRDHPRGRAGAVRRRAGRTSARST